MADVLVHADAGDPLERPVVELAVVLHADLDPVAQARLPHPFARERGLRVGERDADAAHAVVARRVDQQRAPAAADVQQPLAGLQPQLRADELELALLRGLERLAGFREVRARVDHARAEQRRVEVVRDVVVVLDRGLVARERVQAALAPGLDGGDRRAPEDDGRPEQPDGGGEQRRAVARARPDVLAQADDRLEVGITVDVEGAAHPGPREADLVGRVQEVGERVGRAHLEDGFAAFEDASVPEPQRHRKGGRSEGPAGGLRQPRPVVTRPEERRACLHWQSIYCTCMRKRCDGGRRL